MQETQGTWVQSLDWEDPLEEGMATHSSILAWRLPWTEELGGLQSSGSQRIRYNWSNLACIQIVVNSVIATYCHFLGLIEYVYFIVCSITLEEISGHKNLARTLHRSFHLVLFSLSPYSVLFPYLTPLHYNFSENENLYLFQPFFPFLFKILQDALQCNKFTTNNN